MHNFHNNININESRNKYTQKKWLSVNQSQITLQGILLTGTFNLENTH